MRVLIATTSKDNSAKAIAKRLAEKNMEAVIAHYGKLPAGDFDYYVLRDPYNEGKDLSLAFRKLFEKIGSDKVLDYKAITTFPEFEDKLFQHRLLSTKVPMLRFWSLPGLEYADFSYPIVVKKRISSRGKEIFLIRSKAELEAFFHTRELEDYFFEEFYPAKKDIRVILIGGRVIGAVNRVVRQKPNQGFSGMGVKVREVHQTNQAEAEIAKRCVLELGADFCGVDMLLGEDGQVKVLECNLSPQFISSEKLLKSDIAGHLASFILSKVRK